MMIDRFGVGLFWDHNHYCKDHFLINGIMEKWNNGANQLYYRLAHCKFEIRTICQVKLFYQWKTLRLSHCCKFEILN